MTNLRRAVSKLACPLRSEMRWSLLRIESEAGTGIGKSIAYLLPEVLCAEKRRYRRYCYKDKHRPTDAHDNWRLRRALLTG